MSITTIWWVIAGIAIAVELMTGTFYLLMIALGLIGAAIAAHLGLSLTTQIVVASVVGGGATALWHFWRYRNPSTTPPATNRDVNLDIGAFVEVAEWADNGTTRVNYRGSGWPARRAPGAASATGEHEVVAVEGNWLVLAPRRSPASH